MIDDGYDNQSFSIDDPDASPRTSVAPVAEPNKSGAEKDSKTSGLDKNDDDNDDIVDVKKIKTEENQNTIRRRLEPTQTTNTNDANNIEAAPDEPKKSKDGKPVFSFGRAIALIWDHFISAYSNRTVIQWSFWWALAMCGFLQVQSYVQLLWQQIDPNQENFYNGAVEATLTLFGALGAISAGFLNSQRFEKWDMLILTVCSGLEGGFILIAAFTNTVWIAYLMYILFGVLYQFMITVAR